MKKLINDPRNVVREMLAGTVDLHPGLALLAGEDVVLRAGLPAAAARTVALISGGGSGHEPAHAGYVGDGMLSAAVVGDVFTSPGVDAVLAAIRAVAGPAGALLIVKNYTGDRLNFGVAAELAIAGGIPVETVVVADDVALHDTVARGQWRGIAGTVLVHKVAGAAAQAGLPLAAVAAEARAAASRVGTMGVALGACTVPAAGRPGFELGVDEMELGLGIHGEKGVRRGRLEPADAIVDTIVGTLLAQVPVPGGRVALLVNGLGGTPPMELAIVARHALAALRARGLVVERAWAGNFMTALEMPGCSLSVMAVDDAMLARLDAPVGAPAWPGGGRVAARRKVVAAPAAPETERVAGGGTGDLVQRAMLAAAAAFRREEAALTELDGRSGDGDLGISMVRGAAAVEALPEAAWRDAAGALAAVGNALRRAIAGSSGPFYAAALLRAGRELGAGSAAGSAADWAADWARAFAGAVESIAALGGAAPGDRTMLDALLPASREFTAAVEAGVAAPEAWRRAVAAAEAGLQATATMRPRVGRAAYLGERAMGSPDAGAAAVVVWMRAVAG